MPNTNIIQIIQQGQPNHHQLIGRIVLFELSTGSKVQGKILSISNGWIDTDCGGIRVQDIVFARLISDEEAFITRGGPLGQYPRQLR